MLRIWQWQVVRAERNEIDPMLRSVLKRYSELYPEWELSLISMDRRENPEEQIDGIIAMLNELRGKREA